MFNDKEIPRWRRAEAVANAPPVTEWPEVNVELLEGAPKAILQNKIKAMQQYVAGFPVSQIHLTTGVHPGALPLMLRRCLTLSSDGRILGFRALIPGLHLSGYIRTKAIGFKRGEQRGGCAGMLTATLHRFPSIEEKLISLILKEHKRLEISEHRLTPRDLHRIFLKSLSELGVQRTEWPFNTKFLGIRSVQKYMRDLLDRCFSRAVYTREERPAIAHMATGTGDQPLLQFEQPFDAVEIDAYSINALFSVEFEAPNGTSVEVLLDRLWLLAMIDRVSHAVLAYHVVYASEVSADDVLKLLRVAMTQWKPRNFNIPGLAYPTEGGMPSGVFGECIGAQWSVLLLDGALAHLSQALHHTARRQLGFIMNWGPVGHFERRPSIENLFGKISREIFLRFPSTTGSNPSNGRAKDAEQAAIRYRIRAAHTDDLLDVEFAQHNATPSEGLFNLSPLEVVRQHLESERFNFWIRHLPMPENSSKSPLVCRRECVVRGGRHSGRRPHVQLDKAKYTSPVLATSAALVGQKLTIEYDDGNDADYRQVRAYFSNGAELGILSVGGKWAKTKHSRRTRLAINRLVSRRVLIWSQFDDPVRAYFNYLATPTKKGKKGSPDVPSPKNALLASKVAHDGNLPLKIGKPEEAYLQGESIHDTSLKSAFGPSKIDLDKIINRGR
jgi:putative transposase